MYMCVCVCVYTHISTSMPRFLYPFVCGWTLWLFSYVGYAAMNTGIHVFFWISVSVFFGYIPRNGISGLYGSSIFRFWGSTILFSIVAAWILLMRKLQLRWDKSLAQELATWTWKCRQCLAWATSFHMLLFLLFSFICWMHLFWYC